MLGAHYPCLTMLLGLDWHEYLRTFSTPAGRAELADKFVAVAIEHGIDVTVTYE